MVNILEIKSKQPFYIFVVSCVLFGLIYLFGFFLSSNKPFWDDEYYSLTRSIHGVSYKTIWLGQLKWEGNNSPLFYVAHKFLSDFASYDPRVLIKIKGIFIERKSSNSSEQVYVHAFSDMFFYADSFSNIYFRLISIFFMALAPAVLFYYFSLRYSWWLGSFSFLLCLSTGYFWIYGLELRPYILFFTLTIIQMIVFLELIRGGSNKYVAWRMFSLLNILLALTFILSVFQLIVIGGILWFCYRKEFNWPRIISVFVLPCLITLYYYAVSSKERYALYAPWQKAIIANIPIEVLVFSGLFVMLFLLSWARLKWGSFKSIKLFEYLKPEKIRMTGQLLLFLIFLLIEYVLVMLYVRSTRLPLEEGGVLFAYRYLIALVPVGIIAMIIFSRELYLAFSYRWLKHVWILLLVCIVIVRIFRTYDKVHYWIGI